MVLFDDEHNSLVEDFVGDLGPGLDDVLVGVVEDCIKLEAAYAS